MKKASPPVWADKFLEWYCSKDYIEEVQGDLYEWFLHRVKKQGLFKARLFYFIDVIRFLRSYRIKSVEELSQNSNNIAMIKNYLVTSWRSISKNKLFSIINTAGLVVGITAFLLLWSYVRYERSYDQHWDKKERIFRTQLDRYNNGELSTQWSSGAGAIGNKLNEHFPEVEHYAIMYRSNAILEYNQKVLREGHTYYTSKDFFKVFSVNVLEGDAETALVEPFKAAISQSTANKYFGEEDPMGKIITHNGRREYEIVALYEDLPENSHMRADVLYSFASYERITDSNPREAWNWDGFYNYILLAEGTDYKEFEAKIPSLVEKEMGEQMLEGNYGMTFHLQPITDIHLTSNFMTEMKPNGDLQSVNFLSVIALFIVVLAWVNYINLTTAKSMERSKEVGIRKVMGSMRGQLVRQFLVESFLVNMFALLLSIMLVVLLEPTFNALAGRNISFELLSLYNLQLVGALLVLGSLLSGLYPALVISGFKPVAVLKGKLKGNAQGRSLRKGLVVFQFFTSLVLMIGTATVYYQLDYMNSQNLGVDIDQTLVVRGPNIVDSTYNNKLDAFKLNLESQSNIDLVTASSAVPGRKPDWNAGGIYVLGNDPNKTEQYRIIGGDYNYFDAFGIELATGRKFEEDRPNDNSTVLLNESAVDLMGFSSLEESLNEQIFFWGDTFEIVGVVKDYHNESLKKTFEPLIYRLLPSQSSFYSIKINTTDLSRSIDLVEEEWKAQFPGNPFDFFFLDDYYQEQYKADMQFGKVFGLFAVLAIFIACLGLFGLASFVTSQRTKEIGIRKVLGATLPGLTGLLSMDFLKLILIGVVLAIPVAWKIMNDWLDGFAYRMDMSWWLFVVPGVVLLLIALSTISFQTIKSGMANPVDSLRHE